MTNIKPIMLNSTGVDIKNKLSAIAPKFYDTELESISNKVQAINDESTAGSYPSSSALMTYIKKFYPVGKIYISTDSTNPQTLFGFGTWELIQDRFLLAAGTTFAAGTTGGSKDAVVVSHTHTGTANENGEHDHEYARLLNEGSGIGASNRRGFVYVYTTEAGLHSHTLTIDSEGVDGTDKNMPPYVAVYMWKRTA